MPGGRRPDGKADLNLLILRGCERAGFGRFQQAQRLRDREGGECFARSFPPGSLLEAKLGQGLPVQVDRDRIFGPSTPLSNAIKITPGRSPHGGPAGAPGSVAVRDTGRDTETDLERPNAGTKADGRARRTRALHLEVDHPGARGRIWAESRLGSGRYFTVQAPTDGRCAGRRASEKLLRRVG
jgi:hypothetical protein